jgi:hypothetical protein
VFHRFEDVLRAAEGEEKQVVHRNGPRAEHLCGHGLFKPHSIERLAEVVHHRKRHFVIFGEHVVKNLK